MYVSLYNQSYQIYRYSDKFAAGPISPNLYFVFSHEETERREGQCWSPGGQTADTARSIESAERFGLITLILYR